MSNYTKMSNDDLVAELILRDRSIKDMGRRFVDSKEALQKENNHLKRLQGDMDESYKQVDAENMRLKHDLNDAEYRVKKLEEDFKYKELALNAERDENKRNIKSWHDSIEKCTPCASKDTEIEDLKRRIENQKKSMENMGLADPTLVEELKRYKEHNSTLVEVVAMQTVEIKTGKRMGRES